MSGVHGTALLAARPFGPAVRVIDTGTAAGGQGLVALAAASAARAGGSLDEVWANRECTELQHFSDRTSNSMNYRCPYVWWRSCRNRPAGNKKGEGRRRFVAALNAAILASSRGKYT